MQGYVFTPTYVGRDRRVEPRKRFVERRRVDASKLAPSLESALRQLSMRVIELESPRTAPEFRERLAATRALAEYRCKPLVAERLSELSDALMLPGDARKSDLADLYLRQATYVLG